MAARVELEIAKRFDVMNHIVWNKTSGLWNKTCKKELRRFFPSTERIIFAEHRNADNRALGVPGYCDELCDFVFEPIRKYLDDERKRAGIEKAEIDEAWHGGHMSTHWFSPFQWQLPTRENYQWLQRLFNARDGGSDYLRQDYENLRQRPFYATIERPFTDVWNFAPVQNYPGKHPCEKPIDLLQHVIATSTRPGDLVLDCFAGTGSAGVAAVSLGRRFIGVELSAHYCDTARRRLGTAAEAEPIPIQTAERDNYSDLPLFKESEPTH